MVCMENMGASQFAKYIRNKRLFIFGAGELAENCVDIYCGDTNVEAVVDNNPALHNTRKEFSGQTVDIISVDELVNRIGDKKDNVILLITPTFYAADIIEQLDKREELDGVECFVHMIIRNTKEEIPDFTFTAGEPKIPKKIHYFWIGGNPLPEEFKAYIDSWKKFNPDYEIIRWDESNYDFSKVPYMREAYESREWAFAPDYARMDVIYQYGGIYLDTDVEVVKNLDCLLNDDAFFGFASGDRIALGLGFGSVAGHPVIKEMLDIYQNRHFINPDGTKNRAACYYYQHPIFKKRGFAINNTYQSIDGVTVYPAEVMSPDGTDGKNCFSSDKTISIHHGSNLWVNEKERNAICRMMELAKKRIQC